MSSAPTPSPHGVRKKRSQDQIHVLLAGSPGRGRGLSEFPSGRLAAGGTRADIGRDQMLYQPVCTFRIFGLLRTDVAKGLGGYWNVFRIH
jgi:hypothetical protein